MQLGIKVALGYAEISRPHQLPALSLYAVTTLGFSCFEMNHLCQVSSDVFRPQSDISCSPSVNYPWNEAKDPQTDVYEDVCDSASLERYCKWWNEQGDEVVEDRCSR